MASDDSDVENPRKSGSKERNDNHSDGAEDMPEESNAGDEDEDEDEEYEIEKILDHKRDYFGMGRVGYYVKWRGYDEKDNSWVKEEDAGNAMDLITEYWKVKGGSSKAAGPSRSAKGSASASTKGGRRKSEVAEDQSASASAPVKKRSRPQKAQSEDIEMIEAEEDEDDKPKKRSKKATSTVSKSRKSSSSKAKQNGGIEIDEDEKPEVGNMKAYMKHTSWENIVQRVDTVERDEQENIMVFFTLNNGQHVKEESNVCGARFPQKLLRFYESNLKWTHADPESS